MDVTCREKSTASAFQSLNPLGSLEQIGWTLARSPSRQHDSVLSKLALKWAFDLAPELVPVELVIKYPRLANRLALCWSDPALTSRLLDTLLQDRRGGRQGFPPEVDAELVRLRQQFKHQHAAPVSEPWSLLATTDR